MKKFFDYLKVRPLAMASAIVLCVLYLVMIFSDFVAPYRPAATYENNTFHPANIQFTLNGIKVREFRVINRSTWTYARVKDEECIHSFKLFAKGYSYKILGVIPCSRHLFGSSSDYPAYIMGADNLGRDIFSRCYKTYCKRNSASVHKAAENVPPKVVGTHYVCRVV